MKSGQWDSPDNKQSDRAVAGSHGAVVYSVQLFIRRWWCSWVPGAEWRAADKE